MAMGSGPIIIRCGTLLDGAGGTQKNVAVTVAGGRAAHSLCCRRPRAWRPIPASPRSRPRPRGAWHATLRAHRPAACQAGSTSSILMRLLIRPFDS